MASSNNDRDVLSKILQMVTMVEYQSEFEILINRVMGISESLLKSFYISELKLDLQRELLRSRPTTLGEAFSLAQIAETRYEEERPTITIGKPSDLPHKGGRNIYEGCCQLDIQFLNLKELQPNQDENICYYCWENCFSILSADEADNTKPPLSANTFGNNGGDDSETSGPVTPAEEVVGSGHSSTFSSLVEHESPRVLQLWEIIGISDVYELMDNKGSHNFVHPNAGERMHLQAMVTGQPYQGVGGSPKEASWEWMLDSHTPWAAGVGRRKSLKCYVQGSRRRMKKKGVDHDSKRRDCALFKASVFASLNPVLGSFAHRRIWDPKIKSAFQDITLRTRWFLKVWGVIRPWLAKLS
ncbi:hypothetical protein Tco_0563780 [Tanacetum coccineum]